MVLRLGSDHGLAGLRERLRQCQVGSGDGYQLDLALALLETARVVVLVLDAAHRVVFVNRYFEDLTGRRAAELEGRDWMELIPPADAPAVEHRLAASLAGDATVGHVNPVLTRDGRRCVIEWYDRLLRNEHGEPVAVLAIGHDVTRKVEAIERTQQLNAELEARVAERSRELAASHQVLEGTFNATPLLVAYLDLRFDFVRVNRAYAAADGLEPADFIGRNHFAMYPNADNQRIFERVVATGEPFRAEAKPFEYGHSPERGVTHWDWTLTPLKDDASAVTGLVLVLHNVSDRIRAIETARASEARFRQLVESSPDWIAIIDRHGIIAYLNHDPPAPAGAGRGAVIGTPIHELFAPDAGSHFGAILDEVFATGATSTFHPGAARGARRFRIQVVPLPSDAEQAAQALVVVADVTEQQRAAAQRETMLAELDHRVKNTLATVVAIAEQTLGRAESLAAFRETFTGRLRSLARCHEALAASGWAGVDLLHVLSTIIEPLTGRPFELDLSSENPHIPPAIVTPLALVIHELATNAIKHGALARPDGTITVRAWWASPTTLTIDWREVGQRAAPAPSGGGGLGLVLVRGLLEQELGGSLALEVDDTGRRYRMIIPVPEPQR